MKSSISARIDNNLPAMMNRGRGGDWRATLLLVSADGETLDMTEGGTIGSFDRACIICI